MEGCQAFWQTIENRKEERKERGPSQILGTVALTLGLGIGGLSHQRQQSKTGQHHGPPVSSRIAADGSPAA
jgi:hypothetical protein